MGLGCSELWSHLRPHTTLFSGLLCAFQVLVFIYWVEDKYMTVSALLHCIAATLIVLGTLTLFCLYLPHMVSHLSGTSKPRKTAGIMILIGGILHFIASILAIANPIYCNYSLCEVHIFVFMMVPFSICIILFLDEFYLLFYGQIRFRIVVYSFILFVSSILFIPYYATTRSSDDMQINTLMALIFEIIWCIVLINCGVLMFCVGFQHKKVSDTHGYRSNTVSTFNSINTASSTHSTDNGHVRRTPCCCSMHENKRKTVILINCLSLIVFGSSTMVSIYFYSAHSLTYDLSICYYCLVVVVSWCIGCDSIMYYRDMEYEPITQEEHEQNITKGNNPFDAYCEDEEEQQMNEDERNDRFIIEDRDLNYNYNRNNAWGLPPNGYHDDEDEQHNDPLY
eukprot:246900_1